MNAAIRGWAGRFGRLLGREVRKNPAEKKIGNFFRDFRSDGRGLTLAERWGDIRDVIVLRSDDRVLDLGCAEGLITFEVAPLVGRVRAIEVARIRIEAAKARLSELQLKNVDLIEGSLLDPLTRPGRYHVTLFLGVYDLAAGESVIGKRVLEEVAEQTEDLLVIRTNVQHDPRGQVRLTEIAEVLRSEGFRYLVVGKPPGAGGNPIIAWRHAVPWRVRERPGNVIAEG